MQSIDQKMGISIQQICVAKHYLMNNNIVIHHQHIFPSAITAVTQMSRYLLPEQACMDETQGGNKRI